VAALAKQHDREDDGAEQTPPRLPAADGWVE
jgi:hypothetical protein